MDVDLSIGRNGQCAHEFILDLRPYKAQCGVTEEDVAKRLQVTMRIPDVLVARVSL